MFRIKICGITQADDALAAAEAGADALGLNFYPASRRYLEPGTADALVDALPTTVKKVGLFVNAPPDVIRATARRLALDLVQLHGDEPPELLAELEGLPVMKAFRLGPGDLETLTTYLARTAELGCMPALVLIDAYQSGQFGGTGCRADWAVARQYRDLPNMPPLVLAGGLTAENVAEAIAAVRPAAVDTASGVESSPGMKDRQLLTAFVAAAQAARSSG